MVSSHTLFELGSILTDCTIYRVLGALELLLGYILSISTFACGVRRVNLVLPLPNLVNIRRLLAHTCFKGVKRLKYFK